MITEEQLKENPKMQRLVQQALAKERLDIRMPMLIPIEERNNKYNVSDKSERTNGEITWDSKREMERWNELLLEQRAGRIKDLERQVKFQLQEAFISKQYGDVRAIHYIADYVYTNVSLRKGYEGRKVIEDAKGKRTAHYQDKRKMMLYRYAEYLFFEV